MDVREQVANLYRKQNNERRKKYYYAHRDEILKKRHEAYANNPELFAERNRIYYARRKARQNEAKDNPGTD